MKTTHFIHLMLILLLMSAAGKTQAQTQPSMKGIKTERQFHESHLKEIRQYDTLGQCIFEKSSLSGVLRVWALECDPSGKPIRKVTCALYLSYVELEVETYHGHTVKHWAQKALYSGGYDAASANNRCYVDGFPNSLQDLLQHAPLQAALKGPLYLERQDLLNANHLPATSIAYYDDNSIRLRETFTYDAMGREMGVVRTFGDGPDTVTIRIQRDSLGNQLWKARLWHLGAHCDTTHFEINHFVHGKRISCDYYEFRKKVQTIQFEYDPKGQLTQEVALDIGKRDGKPWKKSVTTYDAQGLRRTQKRYLFEDGVPPELNGSARWEYERWPGK